MKYSWFILGVDIRQIEARGRKRWSETAFGVKIKGGYCQWVSLCSLFTVGITPSGRKYDLWLVEIAWRPTTDASTYAFATIIYITNDCPMNGNGFLSRFSLLRYSSIGTRLGESLWLALNLIILANR